MVARFGTPAVAAVGAGTHIEAFALLTVRALGASLIPFIGQNWGARKFDRVHLAQKYSNRFSFSWGEVGDSRPVEKVLFLLAIPQTVIARSAATKQSRKR